MAESKNKSQKKRSTGKKSSSSKVIKPLKSSDIPVTQKMLYGVRDELKSDISSVRLEMKAEFKKVDARFDEVFGEFKRVDSRFCSMEGQFKSIDARLNSMDARFDEVLSEVKKQSAQTSRMLTLIEEQENRNKFVLDGYRSLNDRIEPLERALGKKA